MKDNRYPQMVHEYYVGRLRAIAAQRRERIGALRTRGDAEVYVERARRAVRRAFGPQPPRTPLHAEVTGRETSGGVTIEKVVFQSRPGFFVTGNLYLPAGQGRRPAVLGLCGHDKNSGKAHVPYQSFCHGLAHRGFVVLIIDPIEQGERRQFYPIHGKPLPGLCQAHNIMGNQMVLTGDFFGSWRVWDAIRGLDYLLGRPEVDRRRVGVTGNSGGGTLTTYVSALDSRVTMAAPSCYICSYVANVENEIPSDAEQNPPGILAAGLDQVDLLLTYAPRPTLVLGQELDFFDVRFAREAAADLARVHRLLGSGESADFFAGPTVHGYSRENREAMYGFMMKHAGLKGAAQEETITLVPVESLFAAPGGEVRRLGSRPVFDITADAARGLSSQRGTPDGETVRRSARRLLGLGKQPGTVPHYRKLVHYGGSDKTVGRRAQFGVETEGGIQALLTVWSASQSAAQLPAGAVRVYVGHISGEDDVENVARVRALARRGDASFVALDPRGIGQSAAGTCNDKGFFDSYGSDYLYAATGEMLGESYLGRRVWDVMRTLDLLAAHGAEPIELVGRGLGSIVAAFAGLLHGGVGRVHLLDYLGSYEELALAARPEWPLSVLLRGVLKEFDLPDVYRALGRRLTREHRWDARMRPARKA